MLTGGGGVKKPENLTDVICTWPLEALTSFWTTETFGFMCLPLIVRKLTSKSRYQIVIRDGGHIPEIYSGDVKVTSLVVAAWCRTDIIADKTSYMDARRPHAANNRIDLPRRLYPIHSFQTLIRTQQ